VKGCEVSIENVSKTFGDFHAVDNAVIHIKRGEFFSLLGPSGCGKTTLLRIIAGFEQPDSGVITFDGQNIVGIEAHKRQSNTVFQTYALFPHLSVYENIAFPLRLKKEEMLAIRWAKGSASSGHDRGAMWATFNQSVLTIAVQNAYTTIRFIVANDNYFDYFNAGNQSYVQQNLSQPAQIQQIQQFNHQPQVAQVQPTQQQIVDNSNYNTQQHVVQTQSAPVIPSPNPSPQPISEDIQRELEDFDKVMMQ